MQPSTTCIVSSGSPCKRLEPSEKSSIYTNDSVRSGRARGEWTETLSGFNKSGRGQRKFRVKKTSISSNLMNLSMISKNPDAQKSIVMEYVPTFMNENIDREIEQKTHKSAVDKRKSDLQILKSTRNLKNLDYGKSMFFKEPFNPKIRAFRKVQNRTSNEDISQGLKGYSSNVVPRRNRFNTFAKKKIARAGTYDKKLEGEEEEEIEEEREERKERKGHLNKSANVVDEEAEDFIEEVKNRKRHSTFGRISVADQEKLQKMRPWNNQFQNDFSESEQSFQSEEESQKSEEKKVVIKDSDKNIFEIESDTKLSEKNLSSKALLKSMSKEGEDQGRSSLSPKEKEENMEVIRENASEYREEKVSCSGAEPVEKDEGKIFFERQLKKRENINDMHSFKIINRSIEIEEPSEFSQTVMEDIKRDALAKSRFSLKSLFSFRRFVGMFGGINRNKIVGAIPI